MALSNVRAWLLNGVFAATNVAGGSFRWVLPDTLRDNPPHHPRGQASSSGIAAAGLEAPSRTSSQLAFAGTVDSVGKLSAVRTSCGDSMASGLTLVPPVEIKLSDAEVTAAFAVPAKQRRLLLGVFGANIALNLIGAVLATGILRPFHAHPVIGSMHLITAVLFLVGIFAFWRRTKPRKQGAWAVSFDDAGMRLADDARPARAVPWRAIRSVNDTGTVIVLQYGIWRSTIIPRRAYADDGAALWLLLEQQLIGSRSLHRRADARIIINTAAR